MRRPKFQPSVQGLERRELLATAVSNLVAKPSLLSPPNNRFVNVEVTGTVFENRADLRPSVEFHVVDEYRRFEPSGKVKLSRVSTGVFEFKFTVVLQAKRASKDTAGRQYYVIVGATDPDNSQGLVVPVFVPYNKVSPKKSIVSSSASGGSRLRM